MDEQQLQQQIVQLVQAAMQGDKQATQQIQQIMQAAQQGDQQAAQLAQMIQEVAQQMQQQQVQAAKFGAKLNYIQHLKGVCPEGYEMQLFKQGGQICRKCIKKAMMEDGRNTPQNPVDAFKCDRKMKKKACGGTMTKVKKHLFGGKQRRPFTGFEGLSYQYEAANPSIQSRASRPADEWITNNGKMIVGRETWYDPESNQPEDVGYYYPGYSAERDWESPNEQTLQTRTFNSLKRHALMNQQLREPKFACGGTVKEAKCGTKVEMDKCGKKIKKAQYGTKTKQPIVFDRREANIGNGRRVISENIFDYDDGYGNYAGDMARTLGGRMIYISPAGNDTIYYNYPERWMPTDDGFMPVATRAMNQRAAKKNFYKQTKKSVPANNNSKQARNRALKEK